MSGLPPGQMGNSEVGHLNLGAGRIVYQDLTRINKAIQDGELAKNPVLREAFANAKGSRLHLLGLLSDGGVHSHIDHLIALANAAAGRGRARHHGPCDYGRTGHVADRWRGIPRDGGEGIEARAAR